MQISERVPEDLLAPIFEQLQDQRDLYACSLVSRTFNRAVTPILYRSWDTRVVVDLPANDRFKRSHKIFDPVQTFLEAPELLQYVRHAQATGSIHKYGTQLFDNLLAALSKCRNLESFTWSEQADRLTTQAHEDPMAHSVADQSLRGVTRVLRELPITELTIRSYVGVSEEAWSGLIKISGLKKLSLWCMEGQPRVLQGWSETLGSTLTHLELGRCNGVPPTVLLSVLSHLDQLRNLSLRGAQSTAIPHILTLLPHLRYLDTDYNPSIAKGRPPEQPLISRLRGLTVRTTTDAEPHNINGWIKSLVPYPSLESFKLLGFSVNGDNDLPRRFILDMAQTHGQLLKQFHVTGASLSWPDVQCVCAMFPMIEDLSVLIFTNDITLIDEAILEAKNLRKLNVEVGMAGWKASRNKFSVEEAREMMMREGSRLREIRVAGFSYKGRWVPVVNPENGATCGEFRVSQDDGGRLGGWPV